MTIFHQKNKKQHVNEHNPGWGQKRADGHTDGEPKKPMENSMPAKEFLNRIWPAT
jgi:hypothetical protein